MERERRMTVKTAWIGFVHVQPSKYINPFGEDRKGAFTHALALAKDRQEFYKIVKKSLVDHGLILIEMSDVETVDQYREEGRISDDIELLIDSLYSHGSVQFDVFDTYSSYNS
jgi:carboxypeptidase C (cathepsin A)